ncbi:MAG: hypothetical protein ABJC63_07780, partial [Gemmatimonadales bacterium]
RAGHSSRNIENSAVPGTREAARSTRGFQRGMDFMTEDDRKDEMIIKAASDYNRPPATPREDMWTAIQTARSAGGSGPRLHVAAGGLASGSSYKAQSRLASRYVWLGAAAAAALLIASGIGIGRWISSPSTQSSVAVTKAPIHVAENPGIPVPDIDPNPEPAPAASSAAPDNSGGASKSVSKPRTRDEIRKSPRIIGRGGLQLARNRDDIYDGSAVKATAVSYQVVTQKHLQDAEALLTSYSLEGRDPRMDAQFAGWARGLLSNTRLLLDSPAGDDPRRARLLQDLELVLAQIVQLSPNAATQERDLIQGSISNGHVMTRLRSAIPAGQPRGIQEK